MCVPRVGTGPPAVLRRRSRAPWLRIQAALATVAAMACADTPTAPGGGERVEPVARPAAVRGIYVNAQAAGHAVRLQALLELADASPVNTFVIDVKERGEVSYESAVPLVDVVGSGRGYIDDLRAVLAALRDHGIYPIARLAAFRDPVLAESRPQWAIRTTQGGVWLDPENDRPWVDPYNADVWAYNIDLAYEALAAGFAEIQWDYVRFPDVPDSVRSRMVYPAAASRSAVEAIQQFVTASRDRLSGFDPPITVDVFGRVITVPSDSVIGQDWDALVGITDVILPMVYPSLYRTGNFGIVDPAEEPYRTVRSAMDSAVARTRARPGARATVRPWLQAFTLDGPVYGVPEMQAQIQAVEDAGLEEWLFWNPESVYPLEGLQ